MANIPVPSNPVFTRSGDSVFENHTDFQIWLQKPYSSVKVSSN